MTELTHNVYVQVYVWMWMCIRVCVCECVYEYVYVYMNVHVYVYVYIRIYIYSTSDLLVSMDFVCTAFYFTRIKVSPASSLQHIRDPCILNIGGCVCLAKYIDIIRTYQLWLIFGIKVHIQNAGPV